MQPVNDIMFSSTNALDGAWYKVSNLVAFSIQITGLEGDVWVEASNDPNVNSDGSTISAPASAPTLSQFAYQPASAPVLNPTTVYVKTTYVTPVNVASNAVSTIVLAGETTGSAEANLTLTSGYSLLVASPPQDPAGVAVAYNVYVGSATGTEVLQNPVPIKIGNAYQMGAFGFKPVGIAVPTTNTSGSPNIGINITGNLAAVSYTAPTPEYGETQIIIDTANKQAMVNPSCLVWQWIRVRKSNTAQTLQTTAYLMGQMG
jgi:hypothetical protein